MGYVFPGAGGINFLEIKGFGRGARGLNPKPSLGDGSFFPCLFLTLVVCVFRLLVFKRGRNDILPLGVSYGMFCFFKSF